MIWIPKFHCELNPIEMVWCHSKKHVRAYCNYSIVGLRDNIPAGLASVKLEFIRKFFRKTRDWERAYREGMSTGAASDRTNSKEAKKQYRSHRRVFPSNLADLQKRNAAAFA